jgi:hypothetical protein
VSDKLVERLNDWHCRICNSSPACMGEAADRIEELERALGDARELLSWWQGERGDSIHAAVMERIDALLTPSAAPERQ